MDLDEEEDATKSYLPPTAATTCQIISDSAMDAATNNSSRPNWNGRAVDWARRRSVSLLARPPCPTSSYASSGRTPIAITPSLVSLSDDFFRLGSSGSSANTDPGSAVLSSSPQATGTASIISRRRGRASRLVGSFRHAASSPGRSGAGLLTSPLYGPGSAPVLAESVRRLERLARAGGAGGGHATGSSERQRPGREEDTGHQAEDGFEVGMSVDELEYGTVVGLTEIVLHPPEAMDDGDEPMQQQQQQEQETDGSDYEDAKMEATTPLCSDESEGSLSCKPSRPWHYSTTAAAHDAIMTLGHSIPRRVCQHPFRRNDIVWVCRTCQSDETCVLCHACYSNSNHEGHDVAFYHAQAGGCCDCGDPDAWDPAGFCDKHGPNVADGIEGGGVGGAVIERVQGAVGAAMDWLVEVIHESVEGGYERANPGKGRRQGSLRRGESMPLDVRNESDGRMPQRRRRHSVDNAAVGTSGSATGRRRLDDTNVSSSSTDEDVQPATVITITMAGGEDEMLTDAAIAVASLAAVAADHIFDPEAASTSKSMSQHASGTGNSNKPSKEPNNDTGHDESEEFDPEAASTSKSASPARGAPATQSPSQLLGEIGRSQCGLYLVLHADDHVHSTIEISAALRDLYSSSHASATGTFTSPHNEVFGKIVRLLRANGDIILWGTHELLAEVGDVASDLWRDGDASATTLVGKTMLDKARVLTGHGLVCSIKTRHELLMEQRAASVIHWMSVLSRSCDPLCHRVSVAISGHRHLVPLLHSDLKLPRQITSAWHSLLLTLLAVPSFKADLANAYCDTYRSVTAEYARGVGVLDQSSYSLSVQFLNRVTYVQDLVRERDLLGNLSRSLLETLSVAVITPSGNGADGNPPASSSTRSLSFLSPYSAPQPMSNGMDHLHGSSSSGIFYTPSTIHGPQTDISMVPKLDPLHPVLTHRRYSPCISDLKCVLNVPGMARLFASLPPADAMGRTSCLDDWIQSLSLGQNMDGQVWRSWGQGHVETEPRGWVGAFNASISLGSLFERLLSWEDEDKSPINYPDGLTPQLLSSVELACHVLSKGLTSWQKSEMVSYRPTRNAASLPPHSRCPASLPLPTIATNHGASLAMRALPIAQVRPWSFHLPLHRFVAACLREVARRPTGSAGGGMGELLEKLTTIEGGSQWVVGSMDELFRGIMEFPVVVLSRAAQIRAGLWKRNGPGMQDQVLNYAEPPFCRALRDADLTLLQFAMLGFCFLGKTKTDVADGNGQNKSDHKRPNGKAGEVGFVHLINLLLHRFGVFDFAGFAKAPNSDLARYSDDVETGLYPGEYGPDDDSPVDTNGADSVSSLVLPWTYTPAKDATALLSLLEELLHLLIILITELPSPPPRDRSEHTQQAKQRIRREVIHRLASGPKAHSELTEVHHVLPQRDNAVLSEEGKLVYPDDASGAALEEALDQVAERKSSRGKLAPDQWELRRWAWSEYDPAFFHTSLRSHQSAAENRPTTNNTVLGGSSSSSSKINPQPYAPRPALAHPSFQRIRRDLTSDATMLALVYRTLHVHCRLVGVSGASDRDMTDLRGKLAYEREAMSETALARAVHLLSLGAYAWEDSGEKDCLPTESWRCCGGGGVGSIFYHLPSDNSAAPTAREWVQMVLLSNPRVVMDCDWYEGEENALLLLRRLAYEGGCSGGFVAQDQSVRAGAAWICDFAAKCNPEAATIVREGCIQGSPSRSSVNPSGLSDMERRKRLAKERAMERMKANMEKFAASMEGAGSNDGENDDDSILYDNVGKAASTPLAGTARQLTDTSPMDIDSVHNKTPEDAVSPNTPDFAHSEISPCLPAVSLSETMGATPTRKYARQSVSRLLKDRPQCIICVDDGQGSSSVDNADSIDNGKVSSTSSQSGNKSRNDNALAFCGYAQASTVLKGGGGLPPQASARDPLSSVRRFVGTHVTLCGHAVHSSCCESYLKTVAQRDDRMAERLEGGKRGEFRCPLCQRLSNCLVPFIDVGADWVDSPSALSTSNKTDFSTTSDEMSWSESDGHNQPKYDKYVKLPLDQFLSKTKWWASRNDKNFVWDGRCAFVRMGDLEAPQHAHLEEAPTATIPKGPKKMRTFGKKDLVMAWNTVMRTPRSLRRKNHRSTPIASNGDQGHHSHNDEMIGWSSQIPSFSISHDSLGATEVWRRLIDQIADVSHKADLKRIGEGQLLENYGEFRHYLSERAAFNAENRAAGKENVDWPTCISPTTLSDTRRQELSREKLISKLLLSIQAFTYSCCSEAAEVRRLVQKNLGPTSCTVRLDSLGSDGLYSKFGIAGVACNGELVLLPEPSASKEGGTQPFEGRMGKLRYFGLSVMVATSAVAREIVQLCLNFPLQCNVPNDTKADSEESYRVDQEQQPLRAQITYPLLCGHVLTHVVASMCATCGRARARSDSLETAFLVGNMNEFLFEQDSETNHLATDTVIHDCLGFIKLGLLARVLQALLGYMRYAHGGEFNETEDSEKYSDVERYIYTAVETIFLKRKWHSQTVPNITASAAETWYQSCCLLLKIALSSSCSQLNIQHAPEKIESTETKMEKALSEACEFARLAGSSYLADVGLIFQVLVPGGFHQGIDFENSNEFSETDTMEHLTSCLGLEPISEMLGSSLVRDIVVGWYESSRPKKDTATKSKIDQLTKTSIEERLDCERIFRVHDWPMVAIWKFLNDEQSTDANISKKKKADSLITSLAPTLIVSGTQISVQENPGACSKMKAAVSQRVPVGGVGIQQSSSRIPMYSSDKSVPLLGGCNLEREKILSDERRPHIKVLPTSYTDLYAELGVLCPDSEQTALCLVCGEVLNAGGKGECTNHSFECGAGAGIFFLLQECIGLIMHGTKAAYVHSPYVDSHGETPQYRGRPLNLDLDRYDILQELWSGHLVRQKVIAERGSSRQVIIPNFY